MRCCLLFDRGQISGTLLTYIYPPSEPRHLFRLVTSGSGERWMSKHLDKAFGRVCISASCIRHPHPFSSSHAERWQTTMGHC